MTKKEKILEKLKKEYPNYKDLKTQIDQNLLVCEITRKLESKGLISFTYEYREDSSGSWIQVEYYSKIEQTIILDYDANYNFENLKGLAETLINYEKEIKKLEKKITIQKINKNKSFFQKLQDFMEKEKFYLDNQTPDGQDIFTREGNKTEKIEKVITEIFLND